MWRYPFLSALQEVMRDPVVAMDGYTYERSAIESHMRNTVPPALPVSPMTAAALSSTVLIPNRLARDFIAHLFVRTER